MKTLQVRFEKLSPEGKGVAIVDSKPVYVLGAYPDEEAIIEVIDNKHYREGKVIEWVKRSEKLITPKENHYLACSPLQALDYDYQIELKKSVLENCFADFGKEEAKVSKFYKSNKTFGYRNKLEFHFVIENGKLSLAFNKRGTSNEYEILEQGCELGSKEMNQAALEVTELLNSKLSNNISLLHSLKKLIVRESKTTGDIVALVLTTKRDFMVDLTLKDFGTNISGLVIAQSSAKSSLANVNNIISREGKTTLMEKILDKEIKYSFDGFFQNNVEVFEEAVKEIRNFTPECERIVELYSGVGAIGINLADKANNIQAYEISKSSVDQAKENVEANQTKNYVPTKLFSENISATTLGKADVLVLDPPRSGLNPKLISKILECKPTRIIYLSCNPMTLARDFFRLKEVYGLTELMGFDFYPQTEHLESLAILDVKI